MSGCILTVGVRVRSNWTQLKVELGEEGFTHVTLVEEDDKPEEEEEVEQEDASLHQAGEDKGDKDRYAQVTLAGEDDKPEDGEEIEQRRGESSPRTTRKEV